MQSPLLSKAEKNELSILILVFENGQFKKDFDEQHIGGLLTNPTKKGHVLVDNDFSQTWEVLTSTAIISKSHPPLLTNEGLSHYKKLFSKYKASLVG